MGYRPSPIFKKVLDEVLRLKIEGEISDRNGELEIAKRLIREMSSDRRNPLYK